MQPIYRALSLAAAAVMVPAMGIRALRTPAERRRWCERLGRGPARGHLSGSLWLQAVSIGEVRVAETLLSALRRSGFTSPLALSATTAAGLDRAAALGDLAGDVFAFPFDLTGPVRRRLDALRPSAYGSIETEIWPALLHECSRRAISAFIAGGSVSARSTRRYRFIASTIRPALSSLRVACMQTNEDAARIISLGAREEAVVVTGDIKFDAAPREGAAVSVTRLRAEMALAPGRPVLIAGSTAPGEEAIVLEAWQAARSALPDLALIIAPRHRERFDAVAEELARLGPPVARRSRGPAAGGKAGDVFLLDTIGELESAYGLADVAFVGGSLVPRGGQNPLEPARAGVPVLFGPGMDNFRDAADRLIACGGAFEVRGADSLAARALSLLRDRAARERASAAAKAFVATHAGATERTLAALRKRIPGVFEKDAA